jgi:hypothetical protein
LDFLFPASDIGMRWELSPERAFAAWVGAGKCTGSTSSFWLLLSLVVIAALLNFLVSSQQVVCFFFLPTLYSEYHFGRRHATLTAGAWRSWCC